MQLLILRGVCGSGKTFFRTKFKPNTPFIDMADAPIGSFVEREDWLYHKIEEHISLNTKQLIIEGIFAPDSPSYGHLRQFCNIHGFDWMSIIFHRSKEKCLNANTNDAFRTKMVHAYYSKFDS